MRRKFFAKPEARILILLFTLSPCHLVILSRPASAQIVVIDDLILLTSRQQQKQSEARKHRHLDPPGGENLLPPSPGADEPRLGEDRRIFLPSPFVLARRGRRRVRRVGEVRLHAGAEQNRPIPESFLTGPLEVPSEDEGPANALSLNAAIERLVAVNSDLAAQFQDIPKARADILSAGLRNNPLLFVNISNIPYGHFSPQRPTATNYDITVIQPLDINGKRGFRIRAAQEAKNVLETQYQDAVRRKIDRLGETFVDVLEAQQALAALRAGLARLQTMEQTIRGRAGEATEFDAVSLARANAELALPRIEAALLQSRRELALLVGLPREQASLLRVAGTLHDYAPPPPNMEELIGIAVHTRPDLTAHRLGMSRAVADFRRERAEAVDDIFFLYTPFTANDYSPQGKQSTTGWGVSLLVSLPFFDRNQGEIARARVNVKQTEVEKQGLERRVINEVQYAATEYALSADVVRQYQREILPDARIVREEQDRLFTNGQAGFDAWQEAQKEYDEVVREYLEALAYHRRTMLRLNNAVGQRMLP